MQLYHIMSKYFHLLHDLIVGGIHKNTYLFQFKPCFFNISSFHTVPGHETGALRIKNKSSIINTYFLQLIQLLHSGHSTHLNLHIQLFLIVKVQQYPLLFVVFPVENCHSHISFDIYKLYENSLKASIGLFCFIKYSPIKKPWKPCFFRYLIFSTSLMPLSATLIKSLPIFSDILME